ncbi:MAG: hypothetical protein RLZZ440_1453 [Planctomycetota bacterium]
MPVISLRSLILVAGLAAIAPMAQAQTVLGQWNANTTSTFMAASSGTNVATGVAAGYGQGNPPAPFSSVVTTGTPTDPGTDVSGTTYNLSYTVNNPLTTAANESIGLSFKVSTAGMNPGEAVQLSWSQAVGYRASRYYQLLATTDGTTYSPVPVGTGSSITTTVNGFQAPSPYTPISGSASVSVSSTGLIDFQTINQNSLLANSTTSAPLSPYDVGFVNGITFTLPTGQGFENNPNFGFAIVGAFDPNYVGTDGAVGLLSSFAGTDSSDTVDGYNRSSASGGSMRLDLVTVQAVPEPGSLALVGGAIVAAAVAHRRRATR